MPEELTDAQIERQDLIHSIAYRAMTEFLGEVPQFDMEWIGELCDAMTKIAVEHFGKTEMEVYPYIVTGEVKNNDPV